MTIRPAVPADVPALIALVEELATYERAADQVELTGPGLTTALFGPDPVAGCHVAVAGSEPDTGTVVGMALWFRTFSTWTGAAGIHLEDLFVRPEHRGAGHGRALIAALARLCTDRGYRRLEWAVLDWNAPAIAFYAGLGAVTLTEWQTNRLTGAPLRALAET